MNFLIAPDSFKGCLTSSEVCSAIVAGVINADENANISQFPSSDGGEGFCSCMKSVFGGKFVEREVTFPMGEKGKAEFLFDKDTASAYIELASCAGLGLVPAEKRNILSATTLGVGELMTEAVKLGAENLIIGLGGSATNDCGIGLLHGLGVRFYDKNHEELSPTAYSLDKVVRADKSKMIDLSGVKITAACDVRNPLCGKNGAAEVFSRQKGATEAEVLRLDAAAMSFANALGIDPDIAGAGAAGGAGFALIGYLNADYVSGASLLVNSKAFVNALRKADLLITGEGNTDAQTAYGKLVSVAVKQAKEYGVPSVVISGGLSEGYEALFEQGAIACYSLSNSEFDRAYSIAHAEELLKIRAFEAVENFMNK